MLRSSERSKAFTKLVRGRDRLLFRSPPLMLGSQTGVDEGYLRALGQDL